MQFKSFTIPAWCESASGSEEELNSFLRGHRVLSVHRELVACGEHSFWCLLVEYLEGKGPRESVSYDRGNRPDYREILPPEEFERFRVLREVRKAIAVEDSVPPFAIFLDADLAELSKLFVIDEKALLKIKGFGEKKFVRFGKRFLERVATAFAEKSSAIKPDTENGDETK